MKQFFRFLLATCLSVVLFLAGLIALAYGALQTPYVKDHLAEMASNLASNEQQTIQITDIQGHVPWDFSVPSITIADADEVWLRINALRIDWHPLDLLKYTLHIDQLTADEVIISRAPNAQEQEEQAESTPLTSLPDLPTLNIGTIKSPHIALPAAWMGGKDTLWTLEITGTDINALQGALRTKDTQADTSLTFLADVEDAITLDIKLQDDAGGVINRIANYPEQRLSASITAETSNNLATAGQAVITLGDTQALDATFLVADVITLEANGTLPEFVRPPFTFDSHDWTLNLNAQQNDALWTVSDAKATYGNAMLKAAGGVNLEDETFASPELLLSIDDLSPYAENISGNLRLSAVIDGTFDDTNAQINLSSDSIKTGDTRLAAPAAKYSLATSLNAWLEEGWAASDFALQAGTALNDQNISLSAKGETQQNRVIAINSLKATTPYATATGTLSYGLENGAIKADINADQLRLATLTNGQIKGTLNANAKADGTLEKLPVSLSASATNLQGLPDAVSHLIANSASLDANSVITPKTVTIDKAELSSGSLNAIVKGAIPLEPKDAPAPLTLSITHPNYAAINASTEMQQLPEKLVLRDIVFNTQGTKASGTLNVMQPSGLLDGNVNINSSNIAPLLAWGNMPRAEGAMRADIALKASKQQAFNAQINADNIIIPKQQLAIETLSLDASSPNLSQLDQMNIALQSSDIRSNDLLLQTLQVALTPYQNASAFDISLDGAQAGKPVTLSSTGLIASQQQQTDVTLNTLNGKYDLLPFELQRPTALSLNQNNITLQDTLLKLDDGTLQLSAQKTARTVEAMLRLSDMPLSPLLSSAGGSLPPAIANATIAINGASAKPVIQTDATITADIPGDAPNAKINITSNWNNAQPTPVIRNDISMSMKQEVITGNVSVPASLSLQPFAFNMNDNAPLDGALTADMSLNEFDGWTKPLGHQIAGLLKANMALQGTVAEPDFNGTMDLSNLTYDHLRYGVCIREGEVSANFKKDEMLIARISAQGHRRKGTLDGKGKINFTNGDITSNLDMNKLAIFCQGMAEGQIAGTMSVNGKLTDMLAKGDIALGPLDIYIPTGGAETIKTVDYVYQSDLKRQKEDALIALDINVNIPETVYVRGRGLNAELGGGVHVTGSATNPKIEGKFTTERGSLEFLGSNLSINDGYVRFINQNPSKPYVYLESDASADGVDIDFTIKGPASDPKFTFGSSPNLPKDEILALLLFGSRLNEITPFQALQLASAAASLSGKGGGGVGLLGSTRDKLGLDALNVDVDETGSATVGAGKYLTDKVYVGVEQGTQPGSRRFTTEIEVTPSITAETSTTQQGEPTVGVEWKYDY